MLWFRRGELLENVGTEPGAVDVLTVVKGAIMLTIANIFEVSEDAIKRISDDPTL